jgi:hypothetical protein
VCIGHLEFPLSSVADTGRPKNCYALAFVRATDYFRRTLRTLNHGQRSANHQHAGTGSTLVGQGLDSAIFVVVAFASILPIEALAIAITTHWLVKSAYEALATPITYVVVGYLKRKDGVDAFDTDTRFNPLTVSSE